MNNNIASKYKKLEIANRIKQYREFLENCSNDKIKCDIQERLRLLEEMSTQVPKSSNVVTRNIPR